MRGLWERAGSTADQRAEGLSAEDKADSRGGKAGHLLGTKACGTAWLRAEGLRGRRCSRTGGQRCAEGHREPERRAGWYGGNGGSTWWSQRGPVTFLGLASLIQGVFVDRRQRGGVAPLQHRPRGHGTAATTICWEARCEARHRPQRHTNHTPGGGMASAGPAHLPLQAAPSSPAPAQASAKRGPALPSARSPS